MKQQYFGDLSDYRKYGLLRCMSEAGFRVGLLWMLTADDGRTDGQRTDYLKYPGRWRRFDPALFGFLADTVLVQGRRDVAVVAESGLLANTVHHASRLTDSKRERTDYFREALSVLAPTDLVFFDPDNGIEVPSVRYGTAGSRRYLYWREVEATWAAGHSLLIFQHFGRVRRSAFTCRLSMELQGRAPGARVVALVTGYVLFLAAVQPSHIDRFNRALALVSERWTGQIRTAAIEEPSMLRRQATPGRRGVAAAGQLGVLLKAVAFSADRHRKQRRKGADALPYVNHPLDVADILANVGGVTDLTTLVAAVLHDTIEDTGTAPEELEATFGRDVRLLVEEVTDDKRLPKVERKRLQIVHAPSLSKPAKLIKLGDKISNVRDVAQNPPADWSVERRREYLEWTEQVIAGCRGANERLERLFDQVVLEGRRALG